MNSRESSGAAPSRSQLKKAKRFLADAQKLAKKFDAALNAEDREKMRAALVGLEEALTGTDAKRIQDALNHVEARIDQSLAFTKKSTVREYTESILVAVLIAFVLRAFVVEAFKIPTGSMIPTLAVGDHIFVNKFIYGLRIPMTNSWFVEWGKPSHGDVIVFRYPRDLSKDYIKRVVAVAGDRVRVEGQDVFVNGKKLDRSEAQEYSYVDEGEEDGAQLFAGVRQVLAFPERSLGNEPHDYTVIYKPTEPGRLALPNGAELPGIACREPGVPSGATEGQPNLEGVADGECLVMNDFVFVMGDNRDNSSDSRVWGGVPTSYVKGKAMFVWWSRGPRSGIRWDRFGHLVH